MKRARSKKSRIRGLLILVASLWSVIAISLGVMILRDGADPFSGLPAFVWRLAGGLAGEPPQPRKIGENDAMARVDVLDVGQGSGLLIQLFGDEPRAILVDAGETSASDAVCGALDGAGILSLDLLVVTHPHTDHFGGAIEVLRRFEVAELWLPEVPEQLEPTNSTYRRFLEAVEQNGCAVFIKSAAETLEFSGGASLRLLDGFAGSPSELNDTSLCLRLDAGGASFLVTGDGEAAVERALLQGGDDIDADILIAGHHGSNSSSTQEFLNAVSPLASAVSAGRDNEYDLPSPKAVERLSRFGEVYRTDISGSIAFLTDGETIAVSANGIDDALSAGR